MLPILFDPIEHKYTGPQGKYVSATQLLKEVSEPFDTEKHSAAVVYKRGMDAAYWKAQWLQKSINALIKGHAFHEAQEMMSLAAGIEVRTGRIVRVQNQNIMEEFTEDYIYWPDGVYNELLLWNEEFMVAGKADRIILSTLPDGRRQADVEDYKTNERIRRKSYYDSETGYKMLLHPLEHIMDCDYWKYTLQMSIYQWLLEMMGFVPGTRTLLHYPPLPVDMETYPGERASLPTIDKVPYLSREVFTLTSWHAKETKGYSSV